MAIILFTTTDYQGRRKSEFARFLASLVGQGPSPMPIRSYILLQNCTPEERDAFVAHAPSFCRTSSVPGRISVSDARNLMMAGIPPDDMPSADDIVGFPDDDCWLPDGFVSRLAAVFKDRPLLDVLICRVSLQPQASAFDADAVQPATTQQIVRISMSNNMFIRGRLLPVIGAFDPGLGLGTPALGGEDTDYVIRASLQGRQTGFIDRALVGHAEADQSSAAKYYRGSLSVLARHARSRPALMREFLRKFVVGAYFVSRGRLRYRAYGASAREALRIYRTGSDPFRAVAAQ